MPENQGAQPRLWFSMLLTIRNAIRYRVLAQIYSCSVILSNNNHTLTRLQFANQSLNEQIWDLNDEITEDSSSTGHLKAIKQISNSS